MENEGSKLAELSKNKCVRAQVRYNRITAQKRREEKSLSACMMYDLIDFPP